MTLQPFSDEQLNFFKFSSLVLNEFPKALRQTFKTMWDNAYGGRPGYRLWDDSAAVRNLFSTTEGGRTKIPIGQSYNEWMGLHQSVPGYNIFEVFCIISQHTILHHA